MHQTVPAPLIFFSLYNKEEEEDESPVSCLNHITTLVRHRGGVGSSSLGQ